jgi:hypothetical protein
MLWSRSRVRRLAITGLVVSAILVFVVTYPWGDMVGHSHWTCVRWIPFKTGPFRLFDLAGNLLLCVPSGLRRAISSLGAV